LLLSSSSSSSSWSLSFLCEKRKRRKIEMTRTPLRLILLISVGIIIGAVECLGTGDQFTVGVWYGGGRVRAPALSRAPAAERDLWVSDLRNITRLGFNSVKTWVDWATVERTEGVYDFAALGQLFEVIASEQLALTVLIQVYADSAPDWAARRFPDGEFVGSNDRHVHSQSAPGLCFDHEGVRARVLGFYRALGAFAARHAELVYGFDVWSEPHVVNWVWFSDPSMTPQAVEFCFCNRSMARFREFLHRRYGGDLTRLNAAWYRTFEGWDEVQPPRFGTIISYADFLDFKARFIPGKLAEDLALKAKALREGFALPRDVVISAHSSNPSIIGTPFDDYGMANDWLMDEALRDAFTVPAGGPQTTALFGTSVYPIHAGSTQGGRDWNNLAFAYTGAYSASKRRGFFVGELQAG
jgi:beta-galactosidase